jgi:hypothetical protein
MVWCLLCADCAAAGVKSYSGAAMVLVSRRWFWKEWEHRVRCGDEDGGGDVDREEERDGCCVANCRWPGIICK